MLSKTEREYLEGKYKPLESHKRKLNHQIKKKLKEFYLLELPIMQHSNVTEFGNIVTENGNAMIENKRARRDSNPRPNAPQAFALSMLCNEPHDLEKFAFNVVSV